MSTALREILPAAGFEHDIFTPMEAAQILRVGRSTMYKLLNKRKISYIKNGKKILIPRTYLQDFLANNAVLCYNNIEENESVLLRERS